MRLVYPNKKYLKSYNALKAEYDKRINIESPFTIELTYDYHSWNKCEAKAVVKKVFPVHQTYHEYFFQNIQIPYSE